MYKLILFFTALLFAACNSGNGVVATKGADSTAYHLKEMMRLRRQFGDKVMLIKDLESDNLDSVLKVEIKELNRSLIFRKKFLALQNEPELANNSLGYESCRFVFVHCFNLYQYLIRLDKKGGEVRLVFKTFKTLDLRNKTVVDTVILVSTEKKELSLKVWDTLMGKLDRAYFWSMNSYYDRNILDGNVWILEASVKESFYETKYNEIIRRGPYDSNYKEACNYIIGLVGEGVIMKQKEKLLQISDSQSLYYPRVKFLPGMNLLDTTW